MEKMGKVYIERYLTAVNWPHVALSWGPIKKKSLYYKVVFFPLL